MRLLASRTSSASSPLDRNIISDPESLYSIPWDGLMMLSGLGRTDSMKISGEALVCSRNSPGTCYLRLKFIMLYEKLGLESSVIGLTGEHLFLNFWAALKAGATRKLFFGPIYFGNGSGMGFFSLSSLSCRCALSNLFGIIHSLRFKKVRRASGTWLMLWLNLNC